MPRQPNGRPNVTTKPLGRGRVLTLTTEEHAQIDRDVIGTYGGTAHRWGDAEDPETKLARAQAGSAFSWWTTMSPAARTALIQRLLTEGWQGTDPAKEKWKGVVGSRKDRKRQKAAPAKAP